MSVRKRKWKTRLGEDREAWVVDYVDRQGERHIETFATKKEATARHADVAVNVKSGTHVAANKSTTVAQACENWIKDGEANKLERATLLYFRQHRGSSYHSPDRQKKLVDLCWSISDGETGILHKGIRPTPCWRR